MINKVQRVLSLALGATIAGAGCGGAAPDGASADPLEGAIQLALMNAPTDAMCLQVTLEASRSLTKRFDLTPGASTQFLIDRVPVGRVIVDGAAYAMPCDELAGAPLFVSEAPVPVRVDSKEVATVTLKLIRNGHVAVGVDFEASPSAYIVPTAPGVQFKDVLTAGDSVGGYRMAGTPDGLGAFDNGDGTFTVLLGHEFGAGDGIVRAHGGKGSFLSRWVVRTSDLTVLSGQDLIKTVALWDPATARYTAPAGGVAFNRLCSGDLAAPSAWYDAASGLGFDGRFFTDGEESGLEGRAFAHGLDGVSYELPRLGKQSWENIVANPGSGAKTVVAASDDSSPGQVYLYVGDKTSAGSPIERAGLTNGGLFGVRVAGFANEDAATGIPSGTPFDLAPLGNVEAMSGAMLEAAANTALVTRFNRPEDVAWDPVHPNDLYFVTTASFGSASRLWRLRFTDIGNPALGGTIEMLLDGTEGQKMLDNLTVDRGGHVILQEDVGNQVRLGKVWRYDIANDTLLELGQHDPQCFLAGGAMFLTQDEESSGVIDMAGILGAGWYLLDVQAHYRTDAETVQGGQLLAMYAPSWANQSASPVDLAVIGDTPYGAVQIADFPNLIADINAAPGIAMVVHVGDTKSGSARCDDTYFQSILAGFETFAAPLVYSPGDNEWTDCHRANNGAYDPLERLDLTRRLFFPFPGRTLGAVKRDVLSQSAWPQFATFVENTLWSDAQVTFAALHVVGSNNSLLPWYGDDATGTKVDDPTRRIAEEAAREAAVLAWVDQAFDDAAENDHKGVALFMQADMWDPEIFAENRFDGFTAIVRRIADRALAFGKPVLLVNGDSHKYEADQPLAAGDTHYGVARPVPNLTRLTVQGSTTAPLTEWLRLRVEPASATVFSWVRNPR